MLPGYHLLLRSIPKKFIERNLDLPRENLGVGPFNDMASTKLPLKNMYVYPEKVDYSSYETKKKTAQISADRPYLGEAIE
jgi:hypothetical protein